MLERLEARGSVVAFACTAVEGLRLEGLAAVSLLRSARGIGIMDWSGLFFFSSSRCFVSCRSIRLCRFYTMFFVFLLNFCAFFAVFIPSV